MSLLTSDSISQFIIPLSSAVAASLFVFKLLDRVFPDPESIPQIWPEESKMNGFAHDTAQPISRPPENSSVNNLIDSLRHVGHENPICDKISDLSSQIEILSSKVDAMNKKLSVNSPTSVNDLITSLKRPLNQTSSSSSAPVVGNDADCDDKFKLNCNT